MQARLLESAALQSNVQEDLPARIAVAFEQAVHEACHYIGRTAPNPPVGCALLDKDGRILTVAAHHQAGDLHAEALALKQCRELGLWDQIAEAVVTLEPCNHSGRTPPCVHALLESSVQKIWIGAVDPNPHVCGKGAERLMQNGREVILLSQLESDKSHYWAQQCRNLIAPFAKTVLHRKAWLTVKQAINIHGDMYPPAGQKTFTSFTSLKLAHQLRRGTEAIITGSRTIMTDWPSFTVRNVTDHPDRKRLLVICTHHSGTLTDLIPVQYVQQAETNGFRIQLCRDVHHLGEILADQGVIWGLVEGGPKLLQTLKQDDLWDDWVTIQQQAHGEDKISIQTNHGDSPAQLLFSDFYDYKAKEEKCSLAS